MRELGIQSASDTISDTERQFAELDYVVHSPAAARALAENYVGLPMEE